MSLQKLTDFEKKTNELFELRKIQPDDLSRFSQEELEQLRETISEKLNNLKGEELDVVMDKLDPILSQQTKNEIWENNHRRIIQEITTFVDDYGRMPLKIDLAQRVGLSRQTLHKHFKEYKDKPLYSDHLETFRFMTEKLIAKMFQFALKGDVKAGRLYFDMIGQMGGPVIKNQTNYVQVNNLIVSEEKLKALSPEQLMKIEELLTEALNSAH
jgi:AraC-like DNA-binding protein